MNGIFRAVCRRPSAVSPVRKASSIRRAAGLLLAVMVLPAIASMLRDDSSSRSDTIWRAFSPVDLMAAEETAIARRQQEQQRARTMASRLIETILQIQERQLEENGLQELQLYRDIRTMRRNLNKLIDTEMREVVDALVEAQRVTGPARDAKLLEARKLVRIVVIRLSVERQNLLRRLKTAEISEQVGRLVQLETAAMTRTRSLPRQTRVERERLALRVVEDQRLINRLYLQLSEMLAEVSTWSGPLAAGAADGTRILEAAGVKTHLVSAAERLELKGIEDAEGQLASYSAAADHQGKAIAGLMQLLRIIERTQGIVSSERQAAADRLRAIEQKQRQLQKDVEKTQLKVPPPQDMVKAQIEIRREMAGLSDLLKKIPEAERHLDPAVKAASQATSNLFSAKKSETLLEQSKVLAHLKAAQEALANASDAESGDKSAAEYAKQVKSLEAAKKSLTEAGTAQQATLAKSSESPVEDQKPAAEVAKKLSEAAAQPDLPRDVQTRIAEAESAVQAERKELANEPSQPSERKKEAAQKAAKAVERARAEVEAALAESKRREAAVKIGELVRAAEALERAAATEREIAEKAKAAAESKGLASADAKELKRLQEQVAEVAKKIAEGVKETAPKGAEKVAESLKPADAVAKQLADAERKPEAAAKSVAGEVAKQADDAAKQLSEAAREIRTEVRKTADELVRMSDEQLKQVAKAQDAVNHVSQSKPESAVDRLKKLDEARAKIREARTEQLKAEGKPAAAAARELSEKASQAMRKQEAADDAAKQLSEGKAHTQLEATSKQQESADALKSLADEASKRPQALAAAKEGKSDPLVDALQKAGAKGAEAAKETLDGNTAKADAAREMSRQLLQQARKLADEEAKSQAAEKPTKSPDARGQQQVSEAIAEARRLTEEAGSVPGVAPLKAAAEASDKAAQALAKPEPTQANAPAVGKAAEALAENQKKVAESLERAEREVVGAMKQLAKQEAREIAKKGAEAGKIADVTAEVDPGATAALRRAERGAKEGAEELDPDGKGADDSKQLASADKSRAANPADAKMADTKTGDMKTSEAKPEGAKLAGAPTIDGKPASTNTAATASKDKPATAASPMTGAKPAGMKPGEAATAGEKPASTKADVAKSETGKADNGMKSKPGDAAAQVEAATKNPADQAGQSATDKGVPPSDAKSDAEAGKMVENAPRKAEAANDAVRQNIDRAAASLAAREQQIRKDREIARAIGTLAKIQQEAADTISKQREELKSLAEAKPAAENSPRENSATDKPVIGKSEPQGTKDEAGTSNASATASGASEKNPQATDPAGRPNGAKRAASQQLSPREKSAAQSLRRATQQFAAAQRATGQGAVEISGQEQVANKPIRSALDTASQLPVGELPVDERSEGTAKAPGSNPTGDPSQSSGEKNSEKPQGMNDAQESAAGKSTSGKPEGRGSGETKGVGESRGSARDRAQDKTQLGTGFVSRSPDATARAMAGRDGRNALAHPEIAGLEGGPKVIDPTRDGLLSEKQDAKEAGEDASSNSQSSQSGNSSAAEMKNNNSKQASEKGRRDDNPTSANAGKDQAGKGSNASDPRFAGKKDHDEAWFAKLPADLRKALRANADRRAPRAYEERLRRYLESVE